MNKELTLATIRDYVLNTFPETLWWDGYHKHEVFNKDRAYKHRQGLPNEIRIEFDYDDKDESWSAIQFVIFRLEELKYSFAVYYVEGGRSPHIHIYDLDELEELDIEQRKLYRERFLEKLCGDYKPDVALCDEKHLCALEFATHFKYNKPKNLLHYFYNGKNQGVDLDIKLDIKRGKKLINKKLPIKKLKFGDMLRLSATDTIIKQCSFESVFDKYGVKYKGHMALCPFHNDTNYSLSFSNEKGLWKCFGCGCDAKGNVFGMIKRLRLLK